MTFDGRRRHAPRARSALGFRRCGSSTPAEPPERFHTPALEIIDGVARVASRRAGDFAVVCLDVTSSPGRELFEYAEHAIASFSGGGPVIVVALARDDARRMFQTPNHQQTGGGGAFARLIQALERSAGPTRFWAVSVHDGRVTFGQGLMKEIN